MSVSESGACLYGYDERRMEIIRAGNMMRKDGGRYGI